MPYPRAHYYVFVVMAVLVAGFWPSYFAASRAIPWQFHAHGVAASVWVTMVAAQSWTAHNKQLSLHRAIGKASLLVFPFLIAGLAAIADVSAKGFLAGDRPSHIMFGGSFVIGVVVALAAYATVFYRALKYRRKVWVHSGYMLTTPIILFESPFSRLLTRYMPGLTIQGPADVHLVMPAILWSMALEVAIVAAIWLRYRTKAQPFLVAAGFIAAQMIAMGLMGNSSAVKALIGAIGQLPSPLVWLAGFIIGAVTSLAGWNAGKRPLLPIGTAAQPA